MTISGISSIPGADSASTTAGSRLSGLDSPASGLASASDVERFKQLMAQPQAIQSSHRVQAIAPAGSAAGGGGLSDAVSSGIKQAADAFRSRFETLQAGVKQVEKSQSVTGLIALQLESVKMGVEMEFTGKIASKVVQDIEQLTKQQG